jgi:hypothetical protein
MGCGFYRRGFMKEQRPVRGAYGCGICVWYMLHFASMRRGKKEMPGNKCK